LPLQSRHCAIRTSGWETESPSRACSPAWLGGGLARTARYAAREGAASVNELQAAVGKIKAAAEDTSQIIKDVSEIAFQTKPAGAERGRGGGARR